MAAPFTSNGAARLALLRVLRRIQPTAERPLTGLRYLTHTIVQWTRAYAFGVIDNGEDL